MSIVNTASGLARPLDVMPAAIMPWRDAALRVDQPEVERSVQRFVSVIDDPPHGLTSHDADLCARLVGSALDRARPHALATRHTEHFIDMLERGGDHIPTAFLDRDPNPFAPRGALYLAERWARERVLGIHGSDARAGATVYAEGVFQPRGAALPGPRPEYGGADGGVGLVFRNDAALGASLAPRDTFSVLNPRLISGVEHLDQQVLRSHIGRDAVEQSRSPSGQISAERFARAIDQQLAIRDHGMEEYVEFGLRPLKNDPTPLVNIDDVVETRVLDVMEPADRARMEQLLEPRGIPVRVIPYEE